MKRKRRTILSTVLSTLGICLILHAQTNIPPDLDAEGNQPYCPLQSMPIVTSFTIDDPDDSEIESLNIQITSGYEIGLEQLLLTG
ncbi:MAG: hypothetical protein KJO00_02900, partial [Bacteroidia bacterium]|nr:hypothetical protein [Bacteroidia bacterium]NNK71000.1 hypothetical protein [Flavobacteriaceae bacterium]